MVTKHEANVSKDTAAKTITVVREFNAPAGDVWRAWTESSLLDQWWAPKPWRAETKKMDFRDGGRWHYAMVGPDGTRQWCLADYSSIVPDTKFTAKDAFCDENENIDTTIPGMTWNVDFSSTPIGTKVTVVITFATEADMNKIIEMGFEEGFTMALGNLDDVLAG